MQESARLRRNLRGYAGICEATQGSAGLSRNLRGYAGLLRAKRDSAGIWAQTTVDLIFLAI